MTAGAKDSPVFDFTSLDFQSVEADLMRYAQSRFKGSKWTDFNESNEGRRLIEIMSYATDLVAYNENSQVKETVISSVIREQNFRNMAEPLEFELKSASPSVTTLQFTIDPAYLPMTIPATYLAADETGEILFEPDLETIATTVEHSVTATQGRTYSDVVSVSNGLANQQWLLSRPQLITDTLVVSVGGTPYEKIINFVSASPTDTVYRVVIDEDDNATLVFGDGINGRIPPVGQAIIATYRSGGGSQGNLPVGAINRPVTSIPGILSVTNTTSSEGGGPKQSLQDAKRQLPLILKTNDRAVTSQDYAALAVQLVPEVFRASGVPGRFRGGGNPVILYIAPNGLGTLIPAIANKIVTAVRFGTTDGSYGRGMAGKRVIPRTAVYVDLEIQADSHAKVGAKALPVAASVQRAFAARYDSNNVDFAEVLDLQDAYNTVDPDERSIDGLKRVYIRRFSIRPYSGRYVNVNTSGNGSAEGIIVDQEKIPRREWNIEAVTPSGPVPEFTVTQRMLGTVSGLTDNSLEDEDAFFAVNALAGLTLHPREQDQPEKWVISGNTSRVISVTSSSSPGGLTSLFLVAGPGDSYSVEINQSNGRIARATLTAVAASGQPIISVDSSVGFDVGHKVLVRTATGASGVLTVKETAPNSVTFTTNLPFAMAIADTADWWWQSSDGLIGFAVVQGSDPFVVGDQIYVDTYANAADIKLRPENFPKLAGEDLIINAVGGTQ